MKPGPRGETTAIQRLIERTRFRIRTQWALEGATTAEQFDRAAANLVLALRGAGARPEDLVSVQILVTDAGEYRNSLGRIGEIWRERLGRRYPAMALFEVPGLFDPAAKVELVGTAVIPDARTAPER